MIHTPKRSNFTIPLWGSLIVAVLMFACGSPAEKGASEETEASSTAQFVANPQPVPKQEVATLEVGQKAPDFALAGIDGKIYSLADFAEAKVLAIIFTCNHCPTAQAYEERMMQLVKDYEDKGVQVIAISPNSPLGLLFEELGYSDLGDTYEDMQLRAEEMKYNFPYLYDGDDHAASLQYGPVATPHAFVLDESRVLRYVGRLDDSEKPGTANSEDIRAAIDNLLAGEEVANPETKTFGCSTKWAWKTEYKTKLDKEWSELPVTLEEIDAAGIQALLQNDSDKLRLVNIWATWCGPCRLEYPDFIEIHRMFKGRDFEFVSISADKEESHEPALKFLTKSASAVQNYRFSGKDIYEMIEAVDPDWNGALPYTMLIEPGGKKVYKKQETIDPLEMKRVIVDHPMIGRYY